jgi:hypothetical protein
VLAESLAEIDCSKLSARHVSIFLDSAQKARPLTEPSLAFLFLYESRPGAAAFILMPRNRGSCQAAQKKQPKNRACFRLKAAPTRLVRLGNREIFTCLRTSQALTCPTSFLGRTP